MKIYTSYFGQLRNFKNKNIIPISTTAGGWPWWLYKSYNKKQGSCFLNENNIMLGIWEDKFSCGNLFDKLDEKCSKNCLYKDKVPHCQFMDTYLNYLRTIDVNYFLNEFKRVSEEVRKVTKFEDEAIILLMVYEGKDCSCAERPCIQQYFKENNIEVKEWNLN